MKKVKINLSQQMVDDLELIAELELISVNEVIATAIKEHFEESSHLYYAKDILGLRYIPDEEDEEYTPANLRTDEEPPYNELEDDYFEDEIVRRVTIELPDELYEKIISYEKDYDDDRFEIIRSAFEDYIYHSTTLDYYNGEYCDEELGFWE